MAKNFNDETVFKLQAQCFMQKLEGVFGMSAQKYEGQTNEVKWEKIKESLKEFIDNCDPDRISEA